MFVLMAMPMSVMRRSPTIMQLAGSTSRPSIAAESMVASGLPMFAWHLAPVQASMAATMVAASGSPRPPGKGQ